MKLAAAVTGEDTTFVLQIEPGDPKLKKGMIFHIGEEIVRLARVYSIKRNIATVQVQRGIGYKEDGETILTQ